MSAPGTATSTPSVTERVTGRPAPPTATVILGAVGWLAVAATAAGFVGSIWWPFDLVANWRPQLTLLLLLTGAAYVAAVRGVSGAVFLAAGLVNVFAIVPLFLSDPPASEPGAPELRVVSFNVQASNPDRAEVMDYLAVSSADVVFLLESSFEWENAVRRADLPYVMAAAVPSDRSFGITYLARPGLRTRPIPLDLNFSRALGVQVDVGDETVAILALHPLSPTSGSRSAARDDLLEAAAAWLEAHDGLEVVVGDLNASPWSHAFRSLVRRADLRNTMRGHGLQPSWPVGWGPLMIPIDHALVGEGLVATERRTGPALGSDHRPLEVTVQLRVGS